MPLPPVVYVGPSLDALDVRRLLPGCQVMPPVRRGDLHRDRLLGFHVFVILDGVFGQELAVSPREMIDLAQDGALVVGACSMGALRAADCWPAGVEGIGSIYRLFRRGALASDADVALAFSPEPPHRALSVPLVNVRHALSRCVRGRVLSRRVATTLAERAAGMFYTDRTWPRILTAAGVTDPDGSLVAALQRHDLKSLDAVRTLNAIRRRLARCPRLLDDGRPGERRFTRTRDREEPHDQSVCAADDASLQDLWVWLVATGRYRRHAAGAAVSPRKSGASSSPLRSGAASRRSLDASSRLPRTEREWRAVLRLGDPDLRVATDWSRTRRGLARQLMRADSALAGAVWADMTVTGSRDSLVSAFGTARRAVTWARRWNVRCEVGHQQAARADIAHAHGFAAWDMLYREMHASPIWPWVERVAEEIALAKAVRQELFDPGAQGNERFLLEAGRARSS